MVRKEQEQVIYLENNLQQLTNNYLFEENTSKLHKSLYKDADNFLKNENLYEYDVICDETNNTIQRINNNELWLDVVVKLTENSEFVYISVSVPQKKRNLFIFL